MIFTAKSRPFDGTIHNVTIDDEDEAIVAGFIWYVNGDGYVVRSWKEGPKNHQVILHRAITDCPTGLQVDHINGDKLDNRRSNLRICTMAENTRNRGKQRNNKSGYKGVYLCRGKWRSQIRHNGKHYRLGYYATAEQAYAAYLEAVHRLHGEFAHA